MAVSKPLAHYPDESAQGQVLAGAIVTFILATFAVALRFFARRLQKIGFWLDDWLILAAWCLATVFLAILCWSVDQHGMGLHLDKYSDAQAYEAHLDLYIEDSTYSITLALIKLSVLAFYWRVFKVAQIRPPIKVLTVIVLLWLLARLLCINLRCVPLQMWWDPTITDGSCDVNVTQFFLATVSVHLMIDVSLLVLPIPFIRKLQISRSQKWGIYGIFLTGGFICSASIVQLVVCARLDETNPDANWYLAPIFEWAAVEINMTMLSACLASLRPVFLLIAGRRASTARSSSSPYYGNSGSGGRGPSGFNEFHSDSKRSKTVHSDLSELITVSEDEVPRRPSAPYGCNIHAAQNDISLNHLEMGENRIHVREEFTVDRSHLSP